MIGGLGAFFYVAGLWYAAPVFFRNSAGAADRLRAVVLLGIAIPGVLGILDVLYAPLLWLAVVSLMAWRTAKRPAPIAHDAPSYAVLAATLAVLWPGLVRPLLDGDTLLYHLPIAAAFVQAHSIWTHSAPYWVYPPASELFAAGLFAASGRWSLPLAGMAPALLIAARLYSVARAANARPWMAASVPLAFICMPLAAFQSGTLQNDLWLAAFFIEVVSAADRSPASFAACALLKPFGWLEAIVAALAARLSWRALAAGFVPLALWMLRDALLLRGGAGAGFSTPPYFPNAIAGHFGIAVMQLAHGISAVTPQTFVWFPMLAAGLFFPGVRRYAAAGIAALVIYAFLPLAYSSGSTNYVLDASSLRFALPAFACGALIAATLSPRAGVWGAIAAYLVAAWGAWTVSAVFWNDAYTHWAIAAALVALAGAALTRVTRGASMAVAVLAIVLAGRWGASTRAPGFYADWMRQPTGKPTGAFAWIAKRQPARIVAENVRTGAITMSSPRTRTTAAPPAEGCTEARGSNAILFVGSNEDLAAAQISQAFSAARACGAVLYEDGAAIVVRPR